MKKQFISFFLMLGILVVLASCGSKNPQAEHSTTEHMSVDTTNSSKTVAAHYQCPMKCEEEKTYDKPGKCPKCGMDMKEMENHEGHDH